MPRILVVDDDPDTCTFIEELLESPDRQFVSVQDPDAALTKIRHESFDLLISDINLNAPRSGLDLLRQTPKFVFEMRASTCCAGSRRTRALPSC